MPTSRALVFCWVSTTFSVIWESLESVTIFTLIPVQRSELPADPASGRSGIWMSECFGFSKSNSEKRFEVNKVEGAKNPSDLFTKNVPRESCTEHMEQLGFRREGGRARIAAELVG